MRFQRTAPFLAAGAISALTAGCAQQPETPAQMASARGGQCFLASNVTGFHAVDDDTVNVFVGANSVYSLDLLGPCPDVDWTLDVGLRSTGGSSWICGGADAELIVPSPIGPTRCVVTNIRQLGPEAAKAARSAHKD